MAAKKGNLYGSLTFGKILFSTNFYPVRKAPIMIDANSQKALFANVSGKRTETDFDGGRISSDGGSLLLREVDSQIGLTDSLAEVIPDRRDQSRVRHSLAELLKQRIYGLALGYEDLNDHDSLRDDPGLQTSVGKDPGEEEALGSSPTLCRLENGIDREALWKLSEVMVDTFIESYDSPPEKLVLDFDATDDPLHVASKRAAFSMVIIITIVIYLCMFSVGKNLL